MCSENVDEQFLCKCKYTAFILRLTLTAINNHFLPSFSVVFRRDSDPCLVVFFQDNPISRYQKLIIVVFAGARMVEVVLTTGATRCAKLQSGRHHQQTNTQRFTGRMSFLSPNQQCQSTDGK